MAEYIKREYAIDAAVDVYYDTPDIDLSGEKFEAAILKPQPQTLRLYGMGLARIATRKPTTLPPSIRRWNTVA